MRGLVVLVLLCIPAALEAFKLEIKELPSGTVEASIMYSRPHMALEEIIPKIPENTGVLTISSEGCDPATTAFFRSELLSFTLGSAVAPRLSGVKLLVDGLLCLPPLLFERQLRSVIIHGADLSKLEPLALLQPKDSQESVDLICRDVGAMLRAQKKLAGANHACQLELLELRSCGLTDPGLIGKALSEGSCQKLKVLVLSGNPFVFPAFDINNNFWLGGLPKLQCLELEGCNLPDVRLLRRLPTTVLVSGWRENAEPTVLGELLP